MQTLTFTQKLLRQRSFLSSLIPLLALLLGLGASQNAKAQRYLETNLTIFDAPTGGAATSTTYYSRPITTTPQFNGANLGGGAIFNQINPHKGSLTLDAAAVTINSGGLAITPSLLYYRVYSTAVGAIVPGYTPVNLTLTSANNTSSNPVTYALSNAGIDLLNQPLVLGGGTYYVEVYFESTYTDGSKYTFRDPSVAARATFTVAPPSVTPAGGSTEWIGGTLKAPNPGLPGGPNDWDTAANWTNGVPTALSDAIIPVPAAVQPPILNVSTQDYSVRNLTVQGNGVTFRGVVRVTTATLKIYGNIVNGGNGILATTDAPGNGTSSNSSYIVFAGGNQTIDQGRFANVRIENNTATANGSGRPMITASTLPVIKSLFGVLDIPASLTFAPNISANLRTTSLDANGNPAIDQNGGAVVDLITTGSVFGETTTASVLGLFKSARIITIGQKNTFGNIGIDITIFGTSNGATSQQGSITRSTGLAFNPVTTGTGPRPQSIKRVFGNSFNGLQAGFNADVVFHYLNSTSTTNGRYNELGSNVEGRLEMFRTTSGSTFSRLGGVITVDPGGVDSYPGNAGTVEQKGLNSINTLTLADFTANPLPLPVVLSAFDVKRVNSEAVITWSTAMEKNSRGFYVEVSTNGKDFRSLGFVDSGNGNSTSPQSYRFVDSEDGKVGQRYYRLHQVDTDGKVAFSPVRALDFGTGSPVLKSTLQGYPNPFTSDLGISLTGASTGQGMLRLMDLTGRTIRSQAVQLEGAATSLSFGDLSELKAGMYIVQLVLPSGKVQQLKVQKQ